MSFFLGLTAQYTDFRLYSSEVKYSDNIEDGALEPTVIRI
jgi:hypothetical protein